MRSNPFYALSVSAMLLGCWLLSEALHLQAGQVGSLLLLMAVLQLYEILLVALGTFLVRTGRAPRDGVKVLLLESLFLMDAPLLAAECVTADPRVGTAVAVGALALAAAKLAWVRRKVPGLLSPRAAFVLLAQSAFILALPVAAAHLAWALLFSRHTLWLLWWATLALPFARRRLREETRERDGSGGSSGLAAWTWMPAAMVLLHLWAVGYIHSIPFQPAFLAPLLLGLAATQPRDRLGVQVILPALALQLSVGQGAALGLVLPGTGATVSPLGLVLLGAGTTWAWLAWRDRRAGLAVLAAGAGAVGLVGASGASPGDLLERAWRWAGRLLPRDAFEGGILAVVAAFVLLAAGARRSLLPAEDGEAGESPAPGAR